MSRRGASSRTTRGRKTTTTRRPAADAPRSRRRDTRARPAGEAPVPAAQPLPPPPPEEAAGLEPSVPVVEVLAEEATAALATPEPGFAGRVPPPEPPRPLPSSRRAIFFDIENSSRPEHVARVVEYLAVDRLGRRTDFIAVGNWRVVAPDTARLLAHRGAQLVHSAPATGVRDWSDLRIAISAGVWLAGAAPGDVVEIVSDDRAFDAVGDVAASLGISFRRLSYRSLVGAEVDEVAGDEAEAGSSARRRRRGRRGRRPTPPAAAGQPAPRPRPPSQPHPRTHVHPPAPPRPEPRPAGEARPSTAEPHTAPHDAVLGVVRELLQTAAGQPVSLDAVANALKVRGFSRTPGSPRLVTRLRRFKELEVSRSGLVTLVEGGAPASPPPRAEAVPVDAVVVEPGPAAALSAEPSEDASAATPQVVAVEDAVIEVVEAGAGRGMEQAPSRRRRGRRRGGRRRPAPVGAPPEG